MFSQTLLEYWVCTDVLTFEEFNDLRERLPRFASADHVKALLETDISESQKTFLKGYIMDCVTHTIVLHNVPNRVYDHLKERAASCGYSIDSLILAILSANVGE